MINRLGIVIWWVGAVAFLCATLGMSYSLQSAHQCNDIHSQLDQVNRQVDAIESRVSAPAGDDPFSKLMAISAAVPKALSEKQQELATQSQGCTTSVNYLGGLIFALAGIVMWSLSFVLSGSFLRPARRQ